MAQMSLISQCFSGANFLKRRETNPRLPLREGDNCVSYRSCVTSYPPLGQEPGCGSSWVSGSGSITGCNQVSPGAAVNSAGMGKALLPGWLPRLLGGFGCWLEGSVSHELLASSCPGFLPDGPLPQDVVAGFIRGAVERAGESEQGRSQASIT